MASIIGSVNANDIIIKVATGSKFATTKKPSPVTKTIIGVITAAESHPNTLTIFEPSNTKKTVSIPV